MKVREDIRKLTTTQTNLAKALNLTQPRINQLIEEGVIIRDDKDPSGGVMVFRSLQNYFSSKALSPEDSEVDFWAEKARHEKAKRELTELKLQERQGELYEAETVERVLADLLTDFRNKLLGIGHKLASQLENLPAAQICDIIDAEVIANMKELAEGVDKAKYSEAEETGGGRESSDVTDS